jgi:hypothetical protein
MKKPLKSFDLRGFPCLEPGSGPPHGVVRRDHRGKTRVGRSIVYILAIICGVGLTGCTSNRMTYLPDGRAGYAISCSRFYQNWSSCVPGRDGYAAPRATPFPTVTR